MTVLSDAPDLAELRAERRHRLFHAMTAREIDVLVLGRPAEVTYATGARQLWVAGSRPFGPAALLVAATGRIHLLATSEDGVPPEVGGDDLFGLSWNPANLRRSVAAIPGIAAAERIATTSSTPAFDAFLDGIAPSAEIVDGAAVVNSVRARKTRDELACITAATAIAGSVLASMTEALVPGITERGLLGTYLGRLGELGVPTPPTEGVACATATAGPVHLRRTATTDPIAPGSLVVLDPAADLGGYEGGLGTTRIAGGGPPTRSQAGLATRCGAALDALVAACVPGATGGELRAAATSTGEALPEEPIVIGVGIGVEPPVVDRAVGGDAVLVGDQVLSVSAWVTEEGTGGWYERRLVVVGEPPRRIEAADEPRGTQMAERSADG